MPSRRGAPSSSPQHASSSFLVGAPLPPPPPLSGPAAPTKPGEQGAGLPQSPGLARLLQWWLTRVWSCVPSAGHPSARLSQPQLLPPPLLCPTLTPMTSLRLQWQLRRWRLSSSPLSWLCSSSSWPISQHLLFPLPATSAQSHPLVLHTQCPCHMSTVPGPSILVGIQPQTSGSWRGLTTGTGSNSHYGP